MITLNRFIIIYITVITGSAIQGSIGLGFALLASPILLIINYNLVPVPLILCGLLLSILVAIRDHKVIDFSGIGFAIFGRFFGTALAASLIAVMPVFIFKILIGITIIAAVIISLFKSRKYKNKLSLLIAGFFSGIMGTLAAIGGPPIALLYQHEKEDKIRSSLSSYFIIGSIMSLISLRIAGKFTYSELKLFIYIIPAIITGFIISTFILKKLKKGLTRKMILVISGFSGIILILHTAIRLI